jgi:hypothetical protein
MITSFHVLLFVCIVQPTWRRLDDAFYYLGVVGRAATAGTAATGLDDAGANFGLDLHFSFLSSFCAFLRIIRPTPC